MSTTRTYAAVVDRIVDGTTAVLLLERDETTVEQLDVPVESLPEPGRHEGAVFEVDVRLSVDEYRHQPDAETERRRATQERLDRLSKRLGDEE